MADEATPPNSPKPWFAFLDDASMRGRLLWSASGISLVASVLAVLMTGLVHRISSIILTIGFLSALLIISKYPRGDRVEIGDEVIAKTPRDRILVLLQILLLLLYNGGLMVLVFSSLVYFRFIDVLVSADTVAWMPLGLASYLVVLGLVAQMNVGHHGTVKPTWYSRSSILGTWILGGLVLVLGFVMLGIPEFNIGWLEVGETELLVAVLGVGLAVATSMFFVAGIPTAYDVIIKSLQKNITEEDKGQTPPIVYASLVAIGAMLTVGFVLTRLGIVQSLGGILSSEQGAYILILLPVALAAFSLYSSISVYRQGRVGLYKKRIPTKLRNDILVYGFASIAGGFFSFATIMVITQRWDHIGPFETGLDTAKDLIMITILTTVGPIGVYMTRQLRRLDNIELRLPDFLNDLAESRRAGLTLTAALHVSARGDYGPLTDEVRRMSNQVSWGVSFADALNMFAKRVKSSLVERSTNLIVQSAKTGGSVAAILKAAADDAREIKSLETERRSVLVTYLVVIYVTYFVFLTVIAVLDNSFIPQVVAAQEKFLTSDVADNAGGMANAISSVRLDQEALRFTYFNAAIVQAVGNGVVGGLLIEQRITAGFRHVAIMAFSAWIIFRWILAF